MDIYIRFVCLFCVRFRCLAGGLGIEFIAFTVIYSGEGINSNLIPHGILSRYGGRLDLNLISHGLGDLKFGFEACQRRGFIRRISSGNADCRLDPK